MTQHVSHRTNDPLRSTPRNANGPRGTVPYGNPTLPGTNAPVHSHSYSYPQQQLLLLNQQLEPPTQLAYPAYYLGEPRYGRPLPPPSAPQPDEQDLELAYLRGHIAGLDRRPGVEHPTLP